MANQAPPLQTPVDNVPGVAVSMPWHQWFSSLFNFLQRSPDYTDTYLLVPVAGFSELIPDGTKVVTLDPAGVLATGTLTLPAIPYDGQHLEASTTQTVTALTVSASGADTIKNAPTTLAAGAGFAYYYRAANTTWYRLR